MPKASTGISVAELERILDERKSQLIELAKRRDQIQKELNKLDQEIHGIIGVGPKSLRQRKRLKNAKPLRGVVLDILGKSKKGFTLADIEVKVSESGYKSASKNFKNVVYQCLYNTPEIVHDETTGCYRLEKA